jgi:hypothetical protein
MKSVSVQNKDVIKSELPGQRRKLCKAILTWMGWLIGDVVAQWGCGGLVVMSTGWHQTVTRNSPEFESGFPHSLLNGVRKFDCVVCTNVL